MQRLKYKPYYGGVGGQLKTDSSALFFVREYPWRLARTC